MPGVQPDNERSMEAPDFARRSSMEVDQTTRHGHQGANTLSSTGVRSEIWNPCSVEVVFE